MRFIVKQAGSGRERIGSLTGFIKSPGLVIETPTAALFTQVIKKTHFFMYTRLVTNPF